MKKKRKDKIKKEEVIDRLNCAKHGCSCCLISYAQLLNCRVIDKLIVLYISCAFFLIYHIIAFVFASIKNMVLLRVKQLM